MLSNYPDHPEYFSRPVRSTSTYYFGKTIRKLVTVQVKVHEDYNAVRWVEIEGQKYDIETTYIAFEICGAIEHRDVAEGANSLQAASGIIYHLEDQFDRFCTSNGFYIYENDYELGWNRRTLSEVFSFIIRDPITYA